MKLTLYTEGFFDSAHYVTGYEGKCKSLHGHSWKVTVTVRGDESDINEIGILWDFSNIKKITGLLDHTELNTVLPDNPTAENLTLYIWKSLKKDSPHLEFRVRVYENSLSKISYCETGDIE